MHLLAGQGFASLAAVLGDLSALEQLHADGNQAGPAGLAAVTAALSVAPSLRFSLELHDNSADEPASPFAKQVLVHLPLTIGIQVAFMHFE